MTLTTEPESSRILGQGKDAIIERYGFSFWLEMLQSAERSEKINGMPKRFQDAYRFMRRKLRENEVASV
jgi:hypothetical protein